jgi:hypothetical protein
MSEMLAVAAVIIGLVTLVLLLVHVSSRRSLARQQRPRIPAQRSPLTQAGLVKLNQAYGAGQIGEAEYARRRQELLSRPE